MEGKTRTPKSNYTPSSSSNPQQQQTQQRGFFRSVFSRQDKNKKEEGKGKGKGKGNRIELARIPIGVAQPQADSDDGTLAFIPRERLIGWNKSLQLASSSPSSSSSAATEKNLFERMPNELLVEIIELLPPKELLLGLAHTNRWFWAIGRDPHLWLVLYQRSFGTVPSSLIEHIPKGDDGEDGDDDENDDEADDVLDWCAEYWKRERREKPLRMRHRYLVRLIQLVWKTGLAAEGIFRISVGAAQVKEIMSQMKEGVPPEVALPDDVDVHVISGTLKMLLREDTAGLLNTLQPDRHQEFVQVGELVQQHSGLTEESITKLRELISDRWVLSLQLDVFFQLLSMLRGVSDNMAVNKMSPINLSVVFTPTLLHRQDFTVTNAETYFQDTAVLTKLMEQMILHHRRIWPEHYPK